MLGNNQRHHSFHKMAVPRVAIGNLRKAYDLSRRKPPIQLKHRLFLLNECNGIREPSHLMILSLVDTCGSFRIGCILLCNTWMS